MRINKLDLAKTISDFMFLGEEFPEEKAKVIFELKHTLTPHGFEKYIQYYFEKFKGYEIKLNGGTYKRDGGIDLKGIKGEKSDPKYLIVQCKKYGIKDINESQIREFSGVLALPQYLKYRGNMETFFITTSKFTQSAIDFAELSGINLVDFKKIYDLHKIYSIAQFKIDINFKEGKKAVNRAFEKEQLTMNYDDNFIIAEEPTNKEVLQLLKQVRRDLANATQLQLGQIAKNETLDLLSRKRPHNLDALKSVLGDCPSREQKKLAIYGEAFIDRLKYLYKEEEIEKPTFLQKFFRR